MIKMRNLFYFLFKRLIVMTAIVFGMLVLPAQAQDLENDFEVGVDLGFHLNDIDMFAIGILGEYHVTSNVAFGPLFQFGAEEDIFIFGMTGMVKYKVNIPESERLKPYGQMGVGFLVTDVDVEYWDPVARKRRTKSESDTDFLLPVGGGFEYWALEDVAFGSNLLFNISEDVLFSLYFGLRYKF